MKKDSTLTKDYSEILQEQFEFYQNVYTRDERIKFTLTNNTGILLDPLTKLQLDMTISIHELFNAMMTLRANITPGRDGLTLELLSKIMEGFKRFAVCQL